MGDYGVTEHIFKYKISLKHEFESMGTCLVQCGFILSKTYTGTSHILYDICSIGPPRARPYVLTFSNGRL